MPAKTQRSQRTPAPHSCWRDVEVPRSRLDDEGVSQPNQRLESRRSNQTNDTSLLCNQSVVCLDIETLQLQDLRVTSCKPQDSMSMYSKVRLELQVQKQVHCQTMDCGFRHTCHMMLVFHGFRCWFYPPFQGFMGFLQRAPAVHNFHWHRNGRQCSRAALSSG